MSLYRLLDIKNVIEKKIQGKSIFFPFCLDLSLHKKINVDVETTQVSRSLNSTIYMMISRGLKQL